MRSVVAPSMSASFSCHKLLRRRLKHDERRRSGHKNLGQDFEHLPAEAALVRNLEHDDYVTIVCGSIDRLAEAFAELDRDERQRRLLAAPTLEQDDELTNSLQLASASLSPADRRELQELAIPDDLRPLTCPDTRRPYFRVGGPTRAPSSGWSAHVLSSARD